MIDRSIIFWVNNKKDLNSPTKSGIFHHFLEKWKRRGVGVGKQQDWTLWSEATHQPKPSSLVANHQFYAKSLMNVMPWKGPKGGGDEGCCPVGGASKGYRAAALCKRGGGGRLLEEAFLCEKKMCLERTGGEEDKLQAIYRVRAEKMDRRSRRQWRSPKIHWLPSSPSSSGLNLPRSPSPTACPRNARRKVTNLPSKIGMSTSSSRPPSPSDLDLLPGLDLQAAIWRKFRLPINHLDGNDRDPFLLVASFGRCKFRLSEEIVGFLLQSCVGGNAKDFNLIQFGDRVFQSSVSSKVVGFYIY